MLHTPAPVLPPRPQRAKRKALAAAWLSAVVLALSACGGGSDAPASWWSVDGSGASSANTSQLAATLASYATAPLSVAETESLLFMRQEEQLAHDVYAASALRYSLPIFSNIAASETTHAAAVQLLLTRYALPDPLAGLAPGRYASAELQALYDSLLAASAQGLVPALVVGVQIEELDIRDIQQSLLLVDNADIRLVYEHLLRGSRNHLRAFMAQLTVAGGSYTPQYISLAEFNAIVTSPTETGP